MDVWVQKFRHLCYCAEISMCWYVPMPKCSCVRNSLCLKIPMSKCSCVEISGTSTAPNGVFAKLFPWWNINPQMTLAEMFHANMFHAEMVGRRIVFCNEQIQVFSRTTFRLCAPLNYSLWVYVYVSLLT